MISRIISPRGFLRSVRVSTFCKAASTLQKLSEPSDVRSAYGLDGYADVDWDNLGFNLVPTDFMYIMKSTEDKRFEEGQLKRFGNIELSPAAGVLNYGQGIFEGTKAIRRADGRLLLFRPDQNAIRMRIGAERMCMPAPSTDQFINAVKHTALANKRWVPPSGRGSLYIRPLLLGSGPVLGVAPAPEYTFLVYASPVGNYFKGNSKSLSLYVEQEYDRASPRGTGGIKTIANYSPVMKAQRKAKSQGFSDVLYLDSVSKKNLEEVSASNIFIVKGNVISTPVSNGTILEGITRKSVMQIAREKGYEMKERVIPVDDLLDADEVFCTGTAVSVAPVGNITYQDKRIDFRTDGQSVCQELLSTLVGIQQGQLEDKNGWVVEIN